VPGRGSSARARKARVCLDLNVFVAAELALVLGHEGTTPLRLVDACRSGELGLIVSRAMLDRLSAVLQRPPLNLSVDLAVERTELIGELAVLENLLIVGGGVTPVSDEEDLAVLEAAVAGGADYLATYNLRDFAPPAKRDRKEGLLRFRNVLIGHPKAIAVRLGV
jgi:predicted nucleic acid-binding protein